MPVTVSSTIHDASSGLVAKVTGTPTASSHLIRLSGSCIPSGPASPAWRGIAGPDVSDPDMQDVGLRANQMTDEAQNLLVQISSYEQTTARVMAKTAERTYSTVVRTLAIVLLLGILIAAVVAYLVIGQVVRPLRQMREVALAMAQGDLTPTLQVKFHDEVGQTADALNVGTRHVREAVQVLHASAERPAASRDRMAATSSDISVGAAEASTEAATVSGTAGEVSESISTLADGAHQMRMSIGEIARSASDGSGVAAQAVQAARTTGDIVMKLGDSSVQIGNVVKTITAIAEQTNLLALNATIEAARAGESGKSFAVVAGVVKDLVQETARATDDVARQVRAIQADTEGAVAAINQISAIIERVNACRTSVVAAVEEQTATMNEVTRDVAVAAEGSVVIARNIAIVAAATERARGRV